MATSIIYDYSSFDQPEILRVLFHPRPEWGAAANGSNVHAVLIPVTSGDLIGARFHISEKTQPNILFFHGNGEIAADYDDLGAIYNQHSINFLVVDYRGYGASTGHPTVTAMMADCHNIFDFVESWLKQNNFTGPLLVMGRSLGSASAIELALGHQEDISGLILESGFADEAPLLTLLGVPLPLAEKLRKTGFQHIEKIKGMFLPILVIHAEYDHNIAFSQGRALYEAAGSNDKRFLKIMDADHNTIFARGLPEYMGAVAGFAARLVLNASE
jgi:uncharacterized protein